MSCRIKLVSAGLAGLFLTACMGTTVDAPVQSSAMVCDIASYGAVADDDGLDTQAIQDAIDACGGQGGKVIAGAGEWLIGTLFLRSDMELHLAPDARLTLQPDIALFPEITSQTPEGPSTVRAALLGDGVQNFRLTGTGRIVGNGEQFWDPGFYGSGLARPTLPRPAPAIEFVNCSNVGVSDITMKDLPGFAIRFNRCTDVRAEGLSIVNDPRSPNTDGIQIRDTAQGVIRGVDIRTGDDAIVLKSHERPVDRIIVEDSYLESDDGALKFGTGSAVGVTNSVFRNIEINKTRYGIAIFQIDGGRHLNNRFENISITTGGRHSRPYPIFVDVDRREADRTFGQVDDLTFSGIDIVTTGASLITGNPRGRISGLVLEDVTVSVPPNDVDLDETGSKPRGNINIETQDMSVDYASLQAHIMIAHADQVSLDGVVVKEEAEASERAAVGLIDVTLAGPPDLVFDISGEPGPLMLDLE